MLMGCIPLFALLPVHNMLPSNLSKHSQNVSSLTHFICHLQCRTIRCRCVSSNKVLSVTHNYNSPCWDCSQIVIIKTRNYPTKPNVFQIDLCEWMIYKELKIVGNRLIFLISTDDQEDLRIPRRAFSCDQQTRSSTWIIQVSNFPLQPRLGVGGVNSGNDPHYLEMRTLKTKHVISDQRRSGQT